MNLTYNMRDTFVVAKDSAKGWVLVGGLGVLGVGQMWFRLCPELEKTSGFADAPEREVKPGCFGYTGEA